GDRFKKTLRSAKTKSRTKRGPVHNTGVGPVGLNLSNRFLHNAGRCPLQFELPAHNIRVRKEFPKMPDQFRARHKPKQDRLHITWYFCSISPFAGNNRLSDSKIG